MRRQWDGHCPECYCDSISLVYVRPTVLRKRCDRCQHAWNEERVDAKKAELLTAKGFVNNEYLADLAPILRTRITSDASTVTVEITRVKDRS